MHLPPLDSLTYIGGGIIAAVVACAMHHAWTRFVLWADTPWAYTEAILNETTEDVDFEQVTRWYAETDVADLRHLDTNHASAVLAMRPFFAEWDQRVKEESA